MDLQSLQDSINRIGVDIRALLDKETLTADEELRFDAMDADRDKLMKQRDRLIKAEAIDTQLGQSERRTEPPAPQRTDTRSLPRTTPGADVLAGTRAWLLAGAGSEPTPEMRSAAERSGINLGSNHLTLSLPSRPLTLPREARSLTAEHIRDWEQRALGVGTAGAGGNVVPDEMMRPLEEALLSFGGARQVATVIRTGSGAALPWPTANDTSNAGVLLAENTVVTEQDVAFAQLVLEAYKYSSRMIRVSVELLQDSSVNLGQFLGSALGTRIGRITNEHFTVGTGSSQPNGIVTASTEGKEGAAGQLTTFVYDDFVDMEHSVDPAYRTSARWMFHDTSLAAIKKIRIPQFSGDLNGQPLWQPGLATNSPDTILGYPFTINQSMAVPAASARSLLFGALDKYLIRDVREITLVRLEERFADFHQVAFLAFSRHDGDLLDAGTNPVKYFAHAAV